ncbi:MAG: potassium channel protein [Saprospiraceae bacterium]|nr:potassium channel protein [Saprospiraceae bacterium]
MKWFDNLAWYRYRGSYLNHRLAFGLIATAVVIGILGYMIIEGFNLREATYMTIITISTVGFSEVRPLSEGGQIFTSILIVCNVGIFAYSLSTFTALVIEGELFKNLHLKTIERQIRKMKDHIIVCGYGRYGREIADNLLSHRIPFIVIDNNPVKIEEIQRSLQKIIYIEADVTSDEALLNAHIASARAIITTLADDTDNLFTVLSARQLNPSIHIISSSKDHRTEKKLKMAGADHVIMPDRLGGFYMATLITKPGTVEFFSYLSNEFESDIGFEELAYDRLPEKCRNKSIRELEIRKNTGANVIGFKQKDGSFIVNPKPDLIVTEDTSFILLGTKQQLSDLIKYLEQY